MGVEWKNYFDSTHGTDNRFWNFLGSVGTVSSFNTNSTNTTNYTNSTSQSFSIMAAPANPSVSINVTSSVNLGNVIADGSKHSYLNVTQVNVSASGKKQDMLNFFNASGDLVSASDNDRIPLNNLEYSGFSNSSETSFSYAPKEVKTWTFQHEHGNSYTVSDSLTANYYLTVPMGVASRTYTTNITYMVMIEP